MTMKVMTVSVVIVKINAKSVENIIVSDVIDLGERFFVVLFKQSFKSNVYLTGNFYKICGIVFYKNKNNFYFREVIYHKDATLILV